MINVQSFLYLVSLQHREEPVRCLIKGRCSDLSLATGEGKDVTLTLSPWGIIAHRFINQLHRHDTALPPGVAVVTKAGLGCDTSSYGPPSPSHTTLSLTHTHTHAHTHTHTPVLIRVKSSNGSDSFTSSRRHHRRSIAPTSCHRGRVSRRRRSTAIELLATAARPAPKPSSSSSIARGWLGRGWVILV